MVLKLVNDALFGFFVENVNSCSIESNLDGVAASCERSGRYARGEAAFLGRVEVEEDLSTHQLGNVNNGFDGGIGIGFDECGIVVDTFGTDTCGNFLADVVLERGIVCLFSRELDEVLAPVDVNVAALINERAVDEVHLRRTDEACNELVNGIVVKVLRRI